MSVLDLAKRTDYEDIVRTTAANRERVLQHRTGCPGFIGGASAVADAIMASEEAAHFQDMEPAQFVELLAVWFTREEAAAERAHLESEASEWRRQRHA